MNDRDCDRIAKDANIHFESCVDIFYNKHFKFEKNESNLKAANQIEEFFSSGGSNISRIPKSTSCEVQ